MMTFQTTSHNHEGIIIFFTQLVGREVLGAVAMNRWKN